MIISRREMLKPLIESYGGLHVTAYFRGVNESADLREGLWKVVDQTYESAQHVLPPEQLNSFLEPLVSLAFDHETAEKLSGSVVLFRNRNYFRILQIPLEVEDSCQIATSFHVKPVLRWLQADREFLLLGLEHGLANLYLGSQKSLDLVDSIGFGSSAAPNTRMMKRLNYWIDEISRYSRVKLFVAGDPNIFETLLSELNNKRLSKVLISPVFERRRVEHISEAIRQKLRDESNVDFQKVFSEFRLADEEQKVKKNIFQVSRAVAQRQVHKLIVCDDLHIFGKIDRRSGGVAIHPFDSDHEDDCILDDLAQMVLGYGGEVIVARREEIPKGRPVLALLRNENSPDFGAKHPRIFSIDKGA